mgnify:CR=1 FL=1
MRRGRRGVRGAVTYGEWPADPRPPRCRHRTPTWASARSSIACWRARPFSSAIASSGSSPSSSSRAIAGRRNEAQGIRDWRAGVRQGRLLRSAHRSHRARTARRLRAKLVRYYRDEGPVDEVIVELPKGGYAPTFKQRDTPVLVKRSISAALVSRNTVMLQPFTRSQRRARSRILLPRRPRRDRPSPVEIFVAADPRGRHPGRRRQGQRGHAHLRQRSPRRRAPAHHRARDRRRDRLLPLVRVGRCRHHGRVRGAGTCRRCHREEAGAGAG